MNLKPIITLGEIQREPDWLRLTMDNLSRHIFVAGGTGAGKTMFLLLLMRQLATYGVGFTFVTPHPDGREKLLHWCMNNNIEPSRIVDIKPDLNCCVSIDPFAHQPEGNSLEAEAYLRAAVSRTVSAILRNVPLAEQEVMNRMKRFLKTVLYCCGKNVDGEHLGIDKALVLLNPDHPKFDRYVDRLWPHLPDDKRTDLSHLRNTKNARQREQWTESTINRLRELLDSVLLTQMLGQHAPAVNDEEVIMNSKIQIVSVPESDHLSRDQGNVIAGLRISSMMSAAKRIADRLPEDKRVYHILIIDEAENFVGEDLRTGFQELRKFRVSIVIVVQETSCLIKGEMNLLSKVASQCGVQATGNQQDPESLEYLSKAFAYPFLDMTPLMGLQALPVGYDMLQTQSVSFSSTRGMSVGEAQSMTQTHSVTKQRHSSQSIQQSVSVALSSTHTEGESRGHSTGRSVGQSVGANCSQGSSESTQVTHSTSSADSVTRGSTRSTGFNSTLSSSESHGESSQVSDSVTEGESEQEGQTEQRGTSDTRTSGTSRSTSVNTGSSVSDGRSRAADGSLRGGSHSNGTSSSSGSTNGSSESQASGQSHSSGTSASHGTSRSSGHSESRGSNSSRTNGQSEGSSESWGTSESEGRTETQGTSHGSGRTETRSTGRSFMETLQRSHSDSRSVSTSRSTGTTNTEGQSVGHTSGESSGESQGHSTGRTDSRSSSETEGMTVSFNQIPLAQNEILQINTGKLVMSVPDQIAAFTRCIASLPDRVMLVKVRGMDRPFLLRVHHVEDPYVQKKMLVCREWREVKLKQFVALIRKAHPWYFLPCEEEPDEPLVVTQESKRRKRRVEESPMS